MRKKLSQKDQKPRNSKKIRTSDLIIAAGILCLCVPFLIILYNNNRTSRQIDERQQETVTWSVATIDQLLKEADQYNEKANKRSFIQKLTPSEEEVYENTLNPYGDGVMGVIRIPAISLKENIGHTTDDSVLEKEIGHYETTSLPVGGKGSRAVLFGHRGLPTRSLFSRLNEVKENDLIFIDILNRNLAYQVSSVEVTIPEDLSYMKSDPDLDQIVLVTCTPFGINNKRLVITADRTSLPETEPDVSVPFEIWIIAVLIFAVFILAMIRVIQNRKKKSEGQKKGE